MVERFYLCALFLIADVFLREFSICFRDSKIMEKVIRYTLTVEIKGAIKKFFRIFMWSY